MRFVLSFSRSQLLEWLRGRLVEPVFCFFLLSSRMGDFELDVFSLAFSGPNRLIARLVKGARIQLGFPIFPAFERA